MQGVYSVDCHPTMSKVAIGSGDGTVRYLPHPDKDLFIGNLLIQST